MNEILFEFDWEIVVRWAKIILSHQENKSLVGLKFVSMIFVRSIETLTNCLLDFCQLYDLVGRISIEFFFSMAEKRRHEYLTKVHRLDIPSNSSADVQNTHLFAFLCLSMAGSSSHQQSLSFNRSQTLNDFIKVALFEIREIFHGDSVIVICCRGSSSLTIERCVRTCSSLFLICCGKVQSAPSDLLTFSHLWSLSDLGECCFACGNVVNHCSGTCDNRNNSSSVKIEHNKDTGENIQEIGLLTQENKSCEEVWWEAWSDVLLHHSTWKSCVHFTGDKWWMSLWLRRSFVVPGNVQHQILRLAPFQIGW